MTRAPPKLVCVVEGTGDAGAVPRLVTRWLQRHHPKKAITVGEAVHAKSGGRLIHPHDPSRRLGIEHSVRNALNHGPSAVLVVLDADDACMERSARGEPALGPVLRERAQQAAGLIPVSVVVATREFEAWFLADFPALRRRGVFRADARLQRNDWKDADVRRGCKELLRSLCPAGYHEARDQRHLVDSLSFGPRMRARSRSYRKFHDEMQRLVRAL